MCKEYGKCRRILADETYFFTVFICLIIIYIIFRGWKIQVKTEDISFLTEKPAKATKEQVLVMVIMAVCVLFLVLPGLIGFKAFGNKGDIGFIYMLAGIVCSLLKLGDGKKILQKNIPWGIIIMVGGFAALLGVATNTGSVELLSNFLNSSVSPRLAAPLFGAACGIISIFSDAMGVVIPTFVPVAGQMGMAGAISTAALVTAVIGGGMATACAPLSTGGAQFVAYVPERLGKTVFWSQMAVAFGGLIVFILMAFLGIFG